MLNFDNLLQLENAMQPMIDNIKSYDNVIFYGLGSVLKHFFDNYIGWLGKPAFIVDRSAGGRVYNGVPVVSSLADVCERIEGTFCVVITAPTYREEIFIECKKFISVVDIYKHFLPSTQNSFDYPDFIKNNEGTIEAFYFSLADEISKLTLENYLAGKISNDLRYFIKVCVPNKAFYPFQLYVDDINSLSLFDSEQTPYFPKDIFTLPKEVLFIDCGAYNGDTLTDFVIEENRECAAAICIELSQTNYTKLTETAERYNNVRCLHAGVWNENTTIEINDTGGIGVSIDFSKSEDSGTNSTLVPLKKLDTILSDQGLVDIDACKNIYIYI